MLRIPSWVIHSYDKQKAVHDKTCGSYARLDLRHGHVKEPNMAYLFFSVLPFNPHY